jgi:hypothetical protein
MESGSGRLDNFRMGFRDPATGTWTEGAVAPTGAVIGWWSDERNEWVEGIPEGRGINVQERVVETRDTFVAPAVEAKKGFNIWPWLLAALVAAALIFFLTRNRAVPDPVPAVATPAAAAAAEVISEADAAVTEVADAAAMAAGCTPKVASPDAFIKGLKDSKLPIGETVLYTADTDPDGMLGKDGGYDAAFGFTDSRLDKAEGVAGGGVIEFFRDADTAKARAGAAAATAKDELRSFFGPVLVRLSGKMDADQAKEYTTAIGTLTGCEMSG